MISLGPLQLGQRPHIAVSVTDQWDNAAIAAAQRAGMDLAELRVDLFRSPSPDHVCAVARRFAALPTLATLRTRGEGGQWSADEAQRLALFQTLLPLVSAVDIEWSATEIRPAVMAAARAAGKVTVVSHHDFQRTPALEELESYVAQAKAQGADIVKLATMIRQPEDLGVLATLTHRHRAANLVIIGMGARGMISRLALPALGSLFTFAHTGTSTAPGQIELGQMRADLQRYYPDSTTS